MKEPQKIIFNWNQISDELTEEQVEELKSYYHSYHKKYWAYGQALKSLKKWRLLGNLLSIGFAFGGFVSSIATGGIGLVAIGTVAIFIQGWMKHEDVDLNIQNCIYAYKSYEHLLYKIIDILISGDFNTSYIHKRMKEIDDYVIINTPIVDKYLIKYNEKFMH